MEDQHHTHTHSLDLNFKWYWVPVFLLILQPWLWWLAVPIGVYGGYRYFKRLTAEPTEPAVVEALAKHRERTESKPVSDYIPHV